MTVIFHVEALEDLEQIASYISRDNPAAAESVAARIHDIIHNTLDIMPRSGRASDTSHEFAVPHLPYIIAYTPTKRGIDVIGIFHTSLHQDTRHSQIENRATR
jgi:plasmid stabilization system protein ParE